MVGGFLEYVCLECRGCMPSEPVPICRIWIWSELFKIHLSLSLFSRSLSVVSCDERLDLLQ